jgi:hypothetical protein
VVNTSLKVAISEFTLFKLQDKELTFVFKAFIVLFVVVNIPLKVMISEFTLFKLQDKKFSLLKIAFHESALSVFQGFASKSSGVVQILFTTA